MQEDISDDSVGSGIDPDLCDPVYFMLHMQRRHKISNHSMALILNEVMGLNVSRTKISRWGKGATVPSWPEGDAVATLFEMVGYLEDKDAMPKPGRRHPERMLAVIKERIGIGD